MTNPSFYRLDGNRRSGLLLLCDHARNALPPEYGSLGLDRQQFERHIAYDIGAEAVTRGLSERLKAPALLTCYSRLLIDANRGADDPTLIMRLSDGAVVPGNARFDEAERERRIALYHRPYHSAIASDIDRMLADGIVPVLFSVHSFTPIWRGRPRPWHVAMLWDSDRRLTGLALDGFRAMGDLIVGDNEPYDGALDGDTLNIHGTQRGIAHGLIEIRQDLISTQSGVDEWVDRVSRVLEEAMKDPILRDIVKPEVSS